jgi:hypothetical protein
MNKSMFSRFAAGVSHRSLVGTLLKYTKGRWVTGDGKTSVPSTTTFVAIMDSLTSGWLKWGDGKPVDAKMGLVADGFEPPRRDELDDLDSTKWEIAEDGSRTDPWQLTLLLVLVSANGSREIHTFSTTSVGGKNAIADLCDAHAQTTEGTGEYPLVRLATDSYDHKIKARGTVHVPIFTIVGAVDAELFNAVVAGARRGAGFVPASAPASLTSDVGPISIAGGRQPPAPPAQHDEYDEPPLPDPDDPGPEPSDDF